MGSTRIECFAPGKTWEQISGREVWKTIFAGCLAGQGEAAETFLPVSSCFFLLCGETGIGKNALAEAFAGEAKMENYQVFAAYAEDLTEEGCIPDDTLEQLRACMQREKSFLLLRGLDRYSRKKDKKAAGVRQLADFLERLQSGEGSRIIVATAEREDSIPKRIRSKFQICYLRNPDPSEIGMFWERELSAAAEGYRLQEGFTCEDLAEECIGFTYGRLSGLAANLRRYLAGTRSIAGNDPEGSRGTDGGETEASKDGEEKSEERILTPEVFRKVKESVYRPEKRTRDTDDLFRILTSIAETRRGTAIEIGESLGTSADTGASGDSSGGEGLAKHQNAAREENDLVTAHAPMSADPLEGLEVESEELDEAAQLLQEIGKDLHKRPEDYTEEELGEMGYEPEKEAPEDEKGLAEMSAEDREALCAILDFEF